MPVRGWFSLAANDSIRKAAVIDPVAAWREEHAYFSRLLQLLRGQLDVLHRDGEPNYALMQDVVSYLREYGDRVHHPREDVAFARLTRYCPEVELVLARLQQEHRVIAHAGEALSGLIGSALEGNIVPRQQIEAAAATYLVYYENHIQTEDTMILPRAGRHLTADDWEAVRAAAPAVADPLFGPNPQQRFRELRRRIAQEAANE